MRLSLCWRGGRPEQRLAKATTLGQPALPPLHPASMIATYRLQLQPGFGFAEVEALLPYFQRLGVSHLYLSPITEARPGSTHGYDVIDHNAVREDFGGREALDQLLEAAREAGLQFILDFVPNHAGVGSNNAAWQDVLAYGSYADAASYFDIDWDPLKPELHGKILLPFLGQPYGKVLDADELGLHYREGPLLCHLLRQPLRPQSIHLRGRPGARAAATGAHRGVLGHQRPDGGPRLAPSGRG